jgi:hypothetical protein
MPSNRDRASVAAEVVASAWEWESASVTALALA